MTPPTRGKRYGLQAPPRQGIIKACACFVHKNLSNFRDSEHEDKSQDDVPYNDWFFINLHGKKR